jgi:hypothetical protein
MVNMQAKKYSKRSHFKKAKPIMHGHVQYASHAQFPSNVCILETPEKGTSKKRQSTDKSPSNAFSPLGAQ